MITENLPTLPKGWVWATLGDIGWISLGKTPKKTQYTGRGKYKIVKFRDMLHDKLDWEQNDKGFVIESQNVTDQLRQLYKGDVLVTASAHASEHIGRKVVHVSEIPSKYDKVFFVGELMCVRTDENAICPRIVSHYLSFRGGYESIQRHVRGVHLIASEGKQIRLPLPPYYEQLRIVAKIEELFTQLDAGVEALENIKAQLKRYRQVVLKQAFEGKLTEEWRMAHKGELESASLFMERIIEKRKEKTTGKFERLQQVDTSDLPELPEGWVWATSRMLSWYVTSGSRDWKKYYSDSGAIFIRTQDINKNRLSLDNVAFVDLPEKVEGKRALVEEHDILIIITGANVGKVAFVDKEIGEAYISQSVALLKLVMLEMAKYIHLAMIADGFGKTQLEKLVYGMGRPVLSLENVQDIFLPIPSPPEQRKIVDEIERYFSIADEIEQAVEQSVKQAGRLRQSILKKAFEGKLVPQDTIDEPAEKLLERIREDREKQKANEKAGKRKNNRQLRMV